MYPENCSGPVHEAMLIFTLSVKHFEKGEFVNSRVSWQTRAHDLIFCHARDAVESLNFWQALAARFGTNLNAEPGHRFLGIHLNCSLGANNRAYLGKDLS